MQLLSQSLRNQIAETLENYNVPADDRGLLIERIEGELAQATQAIGQAIQHERNEVAKRFEMTQREAAKAVAAIVDQAKGAVRKAYQMGLNQGIEQSKSSGPSIFQIGILVGILVIAAIAVYRELFPRKD